MRFGDELLAVIDARIGMKNSSGRLGSKTASTRIPDKRSLKVPRGAGEWG